MSQFRLNRIINSLLLLGLLSLAPGLQADSPTTPFLRIETGMHTAPIIRIDVDAQERYLVTASLDKTARVWDLTSGKLLQVLRPPIGPGNEGRLSAVAISPDGETVAVGGWTGPAADEMNIYLFDRSNGRLQRRITGLPNVINYLAYSADGRYLAAALGGGHGIRIYRSRDGVEVGRDTDYGDRSLWVEFDRAGRLISTCYDGYIRLYNADFKLLGKRQAPGGQKPFAASFSPAGDRIAVGFDDSTAVNVLSGKDLSLLYAPATQGVDNGNLITVAWSQDGQLLYAGGMYYDKSGMRLIELVASYENLIKFSYYSRLYENPFFCHGTTPSNKRTARNSTQARLQRHSRPIERARVRAIYLAAFIATQAWTTM